MNPTDHWVLVGPTGAGKTSVGRLLASRLDVPFVDLDSEIEARAGKPIAAIFEAEGEPAFRALESQAMREALAAPRSVVATGAGAVLDATNRSMLRAGSRVIHLHADVATQLARLSDSTDRPLIAQPDREQVLREMAAARDPLYASVADVRVDTRTSDAQGVADVLIDAGRLATRTCDAAHQLDVESPRGRYALLVGSGVLSEGIALADAVSGRHALIVTDANVARIALPVVEASLRRQRPDIALAVHVLPPGEPEKTLDRWRDVIHALAALGATRDATVIALGGGVIGDLAGFAAASWMRGVDVVQVPTTLLAMVDSSVGGKTAVDLPAGKNLVGAFHPPSAVIADTLTLRTLPERELRAGLAEVVKYGAVFDASFLDWLDDHVDALLARDESALAEAVVRSCRYKADVVERDPFERGERALLNFGHTFGHAIETEQGYAGGSGGLVHGEAVAVGMVLAARLSELVQGSLEADTDRLQSLLARFGLPTSIPSGLSPGALLARMRLDKKADASGLRFILWDGLGHGRIVRDVPEADVLAVLSGD